MSNRRRAPSAAAQIRKLIDDALQGFTHPVVFRPRLDLQVSHQINPVHHLLGGMIGLLDKLLQLIQRQIHALIMGGIQHRQLLAGMRIKRMLLQMFHVIGGNLRMINFRNLQPSVLPDQTDAFHPLLHHNPLPIMRRQQSPRSLRRRKRWAACNAISVSGNKFDYLFPALSAQESQSMIKFKCQSARRVECGCDVRQRLRLGGQPAGS